MAIILNTWNINDDYEVLDAIFAFDSHKWWFFENSDPSKAFDWVKEILKKKCAELWGDAIISCQFEYRAAVSDSMFGSKQIFEIFAYGTAVKIS